MGDWTITVHGTGPHHNKDYPHDADKMAEQFVQDLRKASQTVHSANFTHGARQRIGTHHDADCPVRNAGSFQTKDCTCTRL